MADRRKGFFDTELGQSITNVRTKATAQNRYKRIGMLIMGLILIITGIVVWIVSANSGKPQMDLADLNTTTAVTTTVTGK